MPIICYIFKNVMVQGVRTSKTKFPVVWPANAQKHKYAIRNIHTQIQIRSKFQIGLTSYKEIIYIWIYIRFFCGNRMHLVFVFTAALLYCNKVKWMKRGSRAAVQCTVKRRHPKKHLGLLTRAASATHYNYTHTHCCTTLI